MSDLLDRLSSRKLWGSIVVTAAMLYNAWGVADRPLDWAEITAVAAMWGLFITAEGVADWESRKQA